MATSRTVACLYIYHNVCCLSQTFISTIETTNIIDEEFTDPTWLILGLLLGICVMISICGYMIYNNVQETRNENHPTAHDTENIQSKVVIKGKHQSPSSKLMNGDDNDDEKYMNTQERTDINDGNYSKSKHITENDFDPYHITENIIIKWFDSTVIIISLLNMLFDIIITIHFISNNIASYWISSIIILIISHIYYVLIYVDQINSIKSKLSFMLFSILLFPVSPILPSLLYLIRAKQLNVCCFLQAYSCCDFIPCCMFDGNHIDTEHENVYQHLSAYSRWNRQSYTKHIGYIIQSMVQSFPMSILQILYLSNSTEEAITILLSISIFVSFVSISVKSLIFIETLDNYTRIFYWLCFNTDILIFYSILYTLINLEHDTEIIENGVITLVLFFILLAVPFVLCMLFRLISTNCIYFAQCIFLFIALMLSLSSWLSVYIWYYSFHRLKPYSKYDLMFWNRIIDIDNVKNVNEIIIADKEYFKLKKYDIFMGKSKGFVHFMLNIIIGFIVDKRKYRKCSWSVKTLGMLYVTSKIMIIAYVPLLMSIIYDMNQMICLGILSCSSLMFIICLLFGQFYVRNRFVMIKNIVSGYYVDMNWCNIEKCNFRILNTIIDNIGVC